MKPTIPGPTLAAYGKPTSPRLVVWYAGTDQDARMEGGACPAYLAALLAAGCFVVRVAPTVEGEDGRQWTEETAENALCDRVEAWRQHSRAVTTATHDHRHEVSADHLPEVLATFGLVTP